METKIYDLKNKSEYAGALNDAAATIRKGGIVVFPTETVYGLGADALNAEACKKIYAAKGRPSDNPLIVHLSDFALADELSDDIGKKAKAAAKAFMPGPLTVIVKKRSIVPASITGGLESVAIRVPSDRYAHAFLSACAVPVAAPSANISGYPSPTREEHVLRDMNGRADVILLGGDCLYGLESTVVDFTGKVPTILRPGAVTYEQLRELLGEVDQNPGLKPESVPKAPGMKYKHYKPNAKVICVIGGKQACENYINASCATNDETCGAAVFEESVANISMENVYSLGSSSLPLIAANRLFDCLRESDVKGVKVLYCMCLEDNGIGRAYRNRLFKASDEIVEL